MQHNFIKKYNFLSNKISINTLIKYSDINIIMPFYHTVSNSYLPHIKHLYNYRNTKEFENELDYLLKYFSPISLTDLVNKNFDNKKKYFFLSFDDGLSEIYNVISPILLKKGIPATFFLNTDFIDNKKLFYRFKASLIFDKYLSNNKIKNNNITDIDILNNKYSEIEIDKFGEMFEIDFDAFLKKQKPYLTTEQIHNLISKGFEIGSHSKGHIQYNTLSLDNQIHETLESIKYLKNTFNINKSAFSFPFSDYGITVDFFNKINNSVDISFGTAGIKIDTAINNYQRIPIEEFNLTAEKTIKAEYLFFILSKFVGKHKIRRV